MSDAGAAVGIFAAPGPEHDDETVMIGPPIVGPPAAARSIGVLSWSSNSGGFNPVGRHPPTEGDEVVVSEGVEALQIARHGDERINE